MRGVEKRFPGVVALSDVDFSVRAGEVHCLVGENGAGKSTLMRILAGAETPDKGAIELDGEALHLRSPHDAQRAGISMIYQEFNLCPRLSVAENVCLGRAPRRSGLPFISWPAMRGKAREVFGELGMDLDVDTPVVECSVAQQQFVEIAKALTFDARVLVMDEPSATLTLTELEGLFALIRRLRDRGLGIVYISHRLDEIFAIGDRVTVLRDGQTVSTDRISDIDRQTIIRRMVGRDITEEFPRVEVAVGTERLRVTGLGRQGVFHDVSFSLRRGEILGLTGLVGSGRTEVARCLFGADRYDAGTIFLDDKPLKLRSPRDAIRNGIALLTEDRKGQGLVLGMNLRENATLANLPAVSGPVFLHRKEEIDRVSELIGSLDIRAASSEVATWTLSGGNQQKVVLAKWLFTNCSVLIFDEPTRGVDVAAKVAIYDLMNELIGGGAAILMISSELPEVLGMCDRILVMAAGRIAGELSRAEASQEGVMRLATHAAAPA